MSKDVLFGDSARQKMVKGVNLLADVLVNRLTPPGQQSGGGLLELVRGLSTNFQRLQPVKGLTTTGI